jgi:hypothetical protein
MGIVRKHKQKCKHRPDTAKLLTSLKRGIRCISLEKPEDAQTNHTNPLYQTIALYQATLSTI